MKGLIIRIKSERCITVLEVPVFLFAEENRAKIA